MATLHLLGTGAVATDAHRTTTMLAVETERGVIAVDCGGDVVQRLKAHGLDPLKLDALLVTHEHADHVGGFPLMMERLWVLGRREPLHVYGIAPALEQVRRVHDAFDTASWEGYPGWIAHEIAQEPGTLVLEDFGLRVTATPGTHAVPVVALRFDTDAGGALTYSCDTAPNAAVARLARGSQVLVHEATGDGPIHSSALQAARTANEVGAARLVLVHLPVQSVLDRDLPGARAEHPDVHVSEDGERLPF